MILAIAGLGLLLVAVSFFKSLFGSTEIKPMLMAMFAAVVVGAAGGVHQALLRRWYRFRLLALRMLAAQVLSGIAVISLAWSGFGVWSLVIGQYAATLTSTVVAVTALPWYPRFCFRPAMLAHSLRYTVSLIGLRLLYVARDNLDRLLIGGLLGVHAAGAYVVATRIAAACSSNLLSSVGQVHLVSLSRCQGNPARFRLRYCDLLRFIGVLMLPPLTGLIYAGPSLTVMLLGAGWSQAAEIIGRLAIVMAGAVIVQINGIALRAANRPVLSLAMTAISFALDAGIILVAAPIGLGRLVDALMWKSVIAAPISLYASSFIFGVEGRVLLASLAPAGVTCFFVAAAMAGIQRIPSSLGASGQAFISGFAGALVYAMAIIAFSRRRMAATQLPLQ
jgi:PST family polysaccharide transporter